MNIVKQKAVKTLNCQSQNMNLQVLIKTYYIYMYIYYLIEFMLKCVLQVLHYAVEMPVKNQLQGMLAEPLNRSQSKKT
jgi:hypothetical protein